jgi:hypothetical protein
MLLAGYSDASENPAVTPPFQLPWSVTPKIVFNPGCHTSYEFGKQIFEAMNGFQYHSNCLQRILVAGSCGGGES